MNSMLNLCRANKWPEVLRRLEEDPQLALEKMKTSSSVVTTVTHQVITSKGFRDTRAAVLDFIVTHIPQAASLRNSFGSFPLHALSQRNTQLSSKIKENLIRNLVEAAPEALLASGGTALRTPLHVIFTDYVSPSIIELFVARAPEACSVKDRNGFLPAHVACSRHCSPRKLQMLLDVYPEALYIVTYEGDTLLSLATKTATKKHPNNLLILAIQTNLGKIAKVNSNKFVGSAFRARETASPVSPDTPMSRGTLASLPSKKLKMMAPDETPSRSATAPTTPFRVLSNGNAKKRTKTNGSAELLLHFSRSFEEE